MVADKLKREAIVILTDRAGPARDCSTTHKHKWLSAGVVITLCQTSGARAVAA